MDANIRESFEYIAEQAKQSFQAHLNGLLEVHGDLLSKIATAKGSNKTGVWVEMSEVEILSGHILETVSNLMAAYQIIDNTNRILNTNCKAYQGLLQNDIKWAISAFRENKISKDEFSRKVQEYTKVRKPGIAA